MTTRKRVKKYGVEWVEVDGLWWATDPEKIGIWTGLTKEELESPVFVKLISCLKFK